MQRLPPERRESWARAALVVAVVLGVALRIGSALSHDVLKDGYHTWWIAAHLLETGDYRDPFADQVGARWLPGYHYAAAGLLSILGPHALTGLRVANALVAGVAIWLVWRLGERLAPGAGAPAALLYALAPWELVTSARSLPESAAWTLGLGAVDLLLAPRDARARWRWLGGIALAAACLLRYEAWFLSVILLAWAAARRRELLPAFAPAFLVMAAWTLSGVAEGAFFVSRLYAQGHAEASYHSAVGLYPESPITRLVLFLRFYLAGVAVLALLAAVQVVHRPRRVEVAIPLLFGAAVGGAVALGLSDGSPRYFGFAIPFLCALAGATLARLRAGPRAPRMRRTPRSPWIAAAAVGAVLLAQGGLTAWTLSEHGGTAVYEAPARRAGEWIRAHPPREGALVVSESPGAAYWSGVDPGLLVGSKDLPDAQAETMAFLRERADLIVYVNDSVEKYPYYRLGALFPELAAGETTAGFELVHDPNGWERAYGARPIYVYRVRGPT